MSRFFSSKQAPKAKGDETTSSVAQLEPLSVSVERIQTLHSPSPPVDYVVCEFLGFRSNSDLRHVPKKSSYVCPPSHKHSRDRSTTYYTWSDSGSRSMLRPSQRKNKEAAKQAVSVTVSQGSGHGQGSPPVPEATKGNHTQIRTIPHDLFSQSPMAHTNQLESSYDRELDGHGVATPKPTNSAADAPQDRDYAHVKQSTASEEPAHQSKPRSKNERLPYHKSGDFTKEQGPEAFDRAFTRLRESCKFTVDNTSRDRRFSYSEGQETRKITETGNVHSFEPRCGVSADLSQNAKAGATGDEPGTLVYSSDVPELFQLQPQQPEWAEGQSSTADGNRSHPATWIGYATSKNNAWPDYPSIYEQQVPPDPALANDTWASISFDQGFPGQVLEYLDLDDGFEYVETNLDHDQGQSEHAQHLESPQWPMPMTGSGGLSLYTEPHPQIAREQPSALHNECAETETSEDPSGFWRPQRLY